MGDIAYYGVYELSKHHLVKYLGDYWGIFFAGGFGGMAFWTLIYPLDVVKSHLQSQPIPRNLQYYTNIKDCAQKLWKKDGIRGFWRGYGVCLFRSFPTNAAGFFTYEYCKEFYLRKIK